MPLPSAGNSLSLNQLHIEAGGTSETECSLNDSDIRTIIGVSAAGSQNIQQYYGLSATSVEVATVTNTVGTQVYSFSFSGGVSDHDVIIVGNFNYSALSSGSTYPYVQTVANARFQQTQTANKIAWSGTYANEFQIQHIVCGASTPNSFTWNAGSTLYINAQAGMVAIKYSTDGTTSVNGLDTNILAVSGLTNINNPSNSSNTSLKQPATGSGGLLTPNSSTQDGLITAAFKGGTQTNDWGFDISGDVNGSISLANSNQLKYYTKLETPPSSGSYSTTNVTTGYGGTSWMYGSYSAYLIR